MRFLRSVFFWLLGLGSFAILGGFDFSLEFLGGFHQGGRYRFSSWLV
jgi:hypothetical protein